VRQHPLTFCLTLAGRKSRSAWLFVNGTPDPKAKASTPSNRLSRLRPGDCLGFPRVLGWGAVLRTVPAPGACAPPPVPEVVFYTTSIRASRAVLLQCGQLAQQVGTTEYLPGVLEVEVGWCCTCEVFEHRGFTVQCLATTFLMNKQVSVGFRGSGM
jgi:hypothetical protein